MSLAFGLQVALSGLRAQQLAMDVTAHNIANAGTEGYKRQEAQLVPGISISGSFAMNGPGTPKLGSGVEVISIRRMQSTFIDGQVRTANQSIGSWSSKSESLSQIESILGEPGDNGLSSILDKFWSSWQELATSPESVPARAAVVETGSEVSERINSLYTNLRSIQFQLDTQIKDNVTRINDIATEVTSLNENIGKSISGGYQPNDLMDRRDLLLDQLSQIVKFQVSGIGGAEMMVTINGKVLVQGTHAMEVEATLGGNAWSQISWADNGWPLDPTDGQLKGQIEARDTLIQGYIDDLNTLAETIVTSVNAQHSLGTLPNGNPAGNFFVAGGDASSIAVQGTLQANPALVATSYTGRPGDNTLAQNIADVKSQLLIGGQSINDAYASLVGQIGSDSRRAMSQVDVGNLSLEQLQTQRESVSGVSLDEEMINMIRFQQAYNAAARMVTTMDEMIDIVVNRLGIVGR